MSHTREDRLTRLERAVLYLYDRDKRCCAGKHVSIPRREWAGLTPEIRWEHTPECPFGEIARELARKP